MRRSDARFIRTLAGMRLTGQFAEYRFRRRRRNLECDLFNMGQVTLWHSVKEENDRLGVWPRRRRSRRG